MNHQEYNYQPSYYESFDYDNELPDTGYRMTNDIPPSYNHGWTTNDITSTSSSSSQGHLFTHFSHSQSKPSVHQPDYSLRTVEPYDLFNVKDDTLRIESALESGDKDTLIDILCQRSAHQRQQIAEFYEANNGIRLVKNIKNKISRFSDFSILMCGLSIPLSEFLARVIHNTSRYRWICSIIITLSRDERLAIKACFDAKYEKDMCEFIKDTIMNSKDHPERHLIPQILRCIQPTRGFVATYEKNSIGYDAYELIKLNDSREGKEYIKWMFYNQSFEHILEVTERYEEIRTQHNGEIIETLLENNFNKNLLFLYNIITYARSPVNHFTTLLHMSMKGLGTKTQLLTSVVLMRCEIDMVAIKENFFTTYGGTLRQWIKDDTSGYYKYALYKLIGEERSHR